jgi:uncharacterized membrane protein
VQLNELFDVVFRWAHLIAGIMWIGNSMLFNWLDRNLEKHHPGLSRLSQGKIFMLHSGAFYDVEKKLLEPGELPVTLHWFKWQNFTTWATGISLLVIVFYMGKIPLVDPAVHVMSNAVAVTLSVSALFTAWILYDGLWRTVGATNPRLATIISVAGLFAAIFAYTKIFNGPAAYIQTGVMIGTIMTGNVWMVIVPSQHALVEATKTGKEQDASLSIRAKQRSIHNNYLTFPLLFIMLSNHFPSATGHPLNWLVLIAVMIGGAGVRHFMSSRRPRGSCRRSGWERSASPVCSSSLASRSTPDRRSRGPSRSHARRRSSSSAACPATRVIHRTTSSRSHRTTSCSTRPTTSCS